METSNKYGNGKIYKIVDNAYTECYIGSTIMALSSRMALHRRDYKQYKAGQAGYVSSYALFDKCGIENCKIELIEDYSCESKEQLTKREGHYIKQEQCINKNVAGRTVKEWHEEHREQRRDYDKNYRETNKEKKKANDKAYYEANREARQTHAKTYYEANRESISARNKGYNCQKVECPICEKVFSRCSIRRHTLKKHQALE